MDFQHQYTKQQTLFRKEVSSWLDSNIPDEFKLEATPDITSENYWNKYSLFRTRLASKGWLTPNQSREDGGAGLKADKALILVEELEERGLLWILDLGTSALAATIKEFGTAYQKVNSMPSLSNGEITLWYTANLDPITEMGSNNLTASLDGDDFLISGDCILYGYHPSPSHLWISSYTSHPDPKHGLTATFLVPANLNGLVLQNPDSLSDTSGHKVFFNDVWVPSACLIAADVDTYSIFHSVTNNPQMLSTVPGDAAYVSDLISYANETTVSGKILSEYPIFKQLLMEIYTSSEVIRIMKVRNSWMLSTNQSLSYEKAHVTLLEKQHSKRLAQVARDIMGIYALLDSEDTHSRINGRLLSLQKNSLYTGDHSDNIDRESDEIAKHLGLGKTKPTST